MKKIYLIITSLFVLLCFAGCGSVMNGKTVGSETAEPVKCSITDMELVNAKDIVAKMTDKEYLRKKMIQVKFESTDKNDYKNIVWISTNTDVATVKSGVNSMNNLFGDISIVGEGQAYIYAQTTDESVVSDKIMVYCGERKDGECYIKSLKLTPADGVFIQSGKLPLTSLGVRFDSPFDDDYKNIQWVSSNPEVAYITSGKSNGGSLSGKINVQSEGKTEVYAKTMDGSIVSNKVMITSGNKFQKEYTARHDIDTYVFNKLKYNVVQEDRLEKKRPFYRHEKGFSEHHFKNSEKFVYKKYTQNSTIIIESINISENTADVKGYAKTFNQNGTDVKCNFTVKLRYNADFSSYEVVSEQYDMPELIRDTIESEDADTATTAKK